MASKRTTPFEELEKNASLNTRQEQDSNKPRELLGKALTELERVKSETVRQQEVQLQLAKGQGQPVLPNRGGRSGTTMSDFSAGYSSDNTQVLSKEKIKDLVKVTDPNTQPDKAVEEVLSKEKIKDLVKKIDPTTQLDEDVEEMLLQIAEDFIENIVTAGCQLAKHRKSSTLEVKDVLLHLERNWNMWIPGYSSEESRQHKRPASTESHKQRMALIRKGLKKGL